MLCSHTRKYERTRAVCTVYAIRSRPIRMPPRVVHVSDYTISIIRIPRLISRALHPFPS